MFYSCVQSPVTVEVNTLASNRSELIKDAAIVQKRNVIHKKLHFTYYPDVNSNKKTILLEATNTTNNNAESEVGMKIYQMVDGYLLLH